MKVSLKAINWIIMVYLLLIIVFSTSVLGSSMRLNKIRVLSVRSDYILHGMMFVPWMILVRGRWGRYGKHILAFFFGLGAGVLTILLTEGLQLMVPFRSFSQKDLIANAAGLALGAFISGRGEMIQKLENLHARK